MKLRGAGLGISAALTIVCIATPSLSYQETPVSGGGTVKLAREGMKKYRSSSELRSYAAAATPLISAQSAKACARAARYRAAVT